MERYDQLDWVPEDHLNCPEVVKKFMVSLSKSSEKKSLVQSSPHTLNELKELIHII